MAIISQVPQNFEQNVIRNVFIQVKFDSVLDKSTVTDYTVILVETDNPEITVAGRVDYIIGTNTVTFQLFDFLKKNTSYTMILVGGVSGIYKVSPIREPFSQGNYVFSFVTGEIVDYTKPLAPPGAFQDGPYFDGERGVYREVFGRTGKPISHIVTTAGQVGPSGTIVPAPWGPDMYLPPSGDYNVEGFGFVSSSPVSGTKSNVIDEINFVFNSDLKSVGSLSIVVSDLLGEDLTTENDIDNYLLSISENECTIVPSGSLTDFRPASEYTVTIGNIKDVIDRPISSITITFKTKISPFYSTVKLIRNLGSLIEKVTDEQIELLIYENSEWAFSNANPSFLIGSPTQAAKDYVTCKTKLDLLEDLYTKGGSIQSKSLADLKISYGPALTRIVEGKIKKLEDCVKKNELLLTTGSAVMGPVSAVKSQGDSRMPSWNRLENPDDFSENE